MSRLKVVAVVVGGVCVLVGIVALLGDPEGFGSGRGRSHLFVKAFQGLRNVFGDPGGGIAMIVLGLVLGGGLYWLARRRG